MAQDKTTLMKALLEAGVHFGHQKRRWNPKMAPYIFGDRNNIYIIDLQHTVNAIIGARKFLSGVAQEGGHIRFVGTKRQAQEVIKADALRCSMFYVNQRWLGGMLTNFQTIRKSLNRLEKLEKMQEDGTFDKLSKKEVSQLTKEIWKHKKNLDGIRKMDKLPQAVFVIDSKKEQIAVHEANKLSIPVVALVDTNCDPDKVSYVIPGNDDAIKSIKLITSLVVDAVSEGRNNFLKAAEKEEERMEKSLAEEPKIKFTEEEKIEKFIKTEDIKLEKEVREKKPSQKPQRPAKKPVIRRKKGK